jgi:hypothetical protein
MVSARRKVTAEEAERLVAEWRASRRALPAWCATQGIDGRSLRYWANRLDLAPLRLLDVTPRTQTLHGSGLRLLVDDVIVEVDDGFLAETLARVLAVVRGC